MIKRKRECSEEAGCRTHGGLLPPSPIRDCSLENRCMWFCMNLNRFSEVVILANLGISGMWLLSSSSESLEEEELGSMRWIGPRNPPRPVHAAAGRWRPARASAAAALARSSRRRRRSRSSSACSLRCWMILASFGMNSVYPSGKGRSPMHSNCGCRLPLRAPTIDRHT